MIALYALGFNETEGERTIAPPPMKKRVTEADFNDTHKEEETIAPPPLTKRVTEKEYWEKYYDYPDKTYEWNNGYLEEKAVSDYSTVSMAGSFSELLDHFLKTYPIAKKTWLEMGFSLTLPQTSETRRPDLGIVLNSNPVPLKPSDRSYGGTYDLCIEAISDSSKQVLKQDTEVKMGEYAAGGVKEYYILDGHDRYTAFYRLNAQGFYTPIPLINGIIESLVLPGFQFRIEDLYHRLSIEEMIEDPVYQGYVLPGYQEERRARQEAEQRADNAEQRAERFAEQLRALGINPDTILNK